MTRPLLLCGLLGCGARQFPDASSLQCETGSFADLDRDGDGVLTPEDADDGETLLSIAFVDAATGERRAASHSRSTPGDWLGQVRFVPGQTNIRNWMGKWRYPPSWTIAHGAPCNYQTNIWIGVSRPDETSDPLRPGEYPGFGFSVDIVDVENWTDDSSTAGTFVVTAVDAGDRVSGFLDGTGRSDVMNGLTRELLDFDIVLEGMAWRSIPGENVTP